MTDAGAGNDDIWGGAGLDVLMGGTGDDWIEGGRGWDVLTGGGGSDHFVFNSGDGPDVITDFQQGADKIVLGDGFSVHIGPFGLDGELATGTQVPLYQGDRDWLFYDTDNYALYQLSPYGEATLLVAFSNPVQLQTSDFVL